MHQFLEKLLAKAARKRATIILAEAEDPRVINATAMIEQRHLANIILLGDEKRIHKIAAHEGQTITSPIINPQKYKTDFSEKLYALRKGKMTKAEAKKLFREPNYFACLLVNEGVADGVVSGNLSTTAETLRAAIHVFGVKPRVKAFSYFFMLNPHETKPYFYADCAFNINPDEKLLAEIAQKTAEEAKQYGLKPKVAMLSYSTHGSGGGEPAEKMRRATSLAKKNGVVVDELQYDAAVIPSIGRHKSPGSPVAGKANVFVFPDLMSANIAYKIAERTGGWHAIGPIIWGLNKPLNDLSRGCSTEDIVAVVALTALHTK